MVRISVKHDLLVATRVALYYISVQVKSAPMIDASKHMLVTAICGRPVRGGKHKNIFNVDCTKAGYEETYHTHAALYLTGDHKNIFERELHMGNRSCLAGIHIFFWGGGGCCYDWENVCWINPQLQLNANPTQ